MSKNKDDKRTVELLDEEILELTFKRVGIGAQLNARSGSADLFKQWCDTQAEIQRLEIERNFLKTGTRGEVPPTPNIATEEDVKTSLDKTMFNFEPTTSMRVGDKFVDTQGDVQEVAAVSSIQDETIVETVPVAPLTGARAWLAEQKARQCGS